MRQRAREDGSYERDGEGTRTGAETTQPRPALGRRPWFALLRRARSLRRFALAMGGRLPDRRSRAGAVVLHSRDDEWSSPPIVVAKTMRRRLVGLRPWSLGHGLIIGGAAVHGIGMVEPLGVVGVDRSGRVVAARRLAPGEALRLEGASLTVELPGSRPLPEVGVRLVARPMLGGCRDA